jgi:HlyD family secretion protein
MTATAVVNTSQVHDALLVPNAALRFVPPTASSPTTIDARTASSGNTHRVWMLDHGAPVPVPLTVRLTDGQWTEIVGGNISAGAPLITGLIDTNTPASGAAKTSTPATASPGASRAR